MIAYRVGKLEFEGRKLSMRKTLLDGSLCLFRETDRASLDFWVLSRDRLTYCSDWHTGLSVIAQKLKIICRRTKGAGDLIRAVAVGWVSARCRAGFFTAETD